MYEFFNKDIISGVLLYKNSTRKIKNANGNCQTVSVTSIQFV